MLRAIGHVVGITKPADHVERLGLQWAPLSTLIAALLLTAVHAKVKPLQLRKTSGIKAVQAVDLGGGKKASGGYGQWAKDNAAANGSA